MLVEKEMKKKWGSRKKHNVFVYKDIENGRTYGTIVCGLGWPYAEKPGFIVVVAQSLEKDHSIPFSPYHLYTLKEFESSDLEELHRHCLMFKEQLCAEYILGNSDDHIYSIWRSCSAGNPSITVTQPSDYDKLNLNYVAQLIRKHGQHNTLHIGAGFALPGFFQLLRAEDIESKTMEHYPPLAALGYALSYLETHSGSNLTGWQPDRSKHRRFHQAGRLT